MRWIWTDANTTQVNTYAEFLQNFAFSGGKAELKISVCDEYAVFVNGSFADCGQYDDYPTHKFYDTLDITDLCRDGDNTLLIRVYYQGADSAQCIASSPKLWYRLTAGQTVWESGRSTLCRSWEAYRSGPCEEISPQMSFTFYYDARQEEQGDWNRATCLDCSVIPMPRPVKKLTILPPAKSAMQNQGVFLRDRVSVLQTVAEQVYSDLLAPRRAVDMIDYPAKEQTDLRYVEQPLQLPGEYCIRTQEGFDGTYVIVDLGKEMAGFVCLELEAEPGTCFEVAYGEHLDDGRVRAYVGGRNFAFSYTAGSGRKCFTHWFKRVACRYLELHARTKSAFTLYHLSVLPAEYPLTVMPYPQGMEDLLAKRIYDLSVETLKLCMHEHYEDCPWREQAMYAMDSRNQALAGFYAFGEYDFPRACWQLFEPALRPDGMFPLTIPSRHPTAIPSFTLAWVIGCQELVSYGGEKYNSFLPTMRTVLDSFSARVKNGILWTPEEKQYWNYFEWADGLSGNNGQRNLPQQNAALTLFFYAALRSYDTVCPDGRYAAVASAVREQFHNTFWNEEAAAYCTVSQSEHYTELVQSLALWCGLVPQELAAGLRRRLADRANPWVKTTLSHYVYKIDALMMEPETYYSAVNRDIMDIWGNMALSGATSLWETADGGHAFKKAGSLCHGWSAAPVYFWHKYWHYRK